MPPPTSKLHGTTSDVVHVGQSQGLFDTAPVLQHKFDQLGGLDFFGGEPAAKETDLWTFANGACLCYNYDLAQAFEIHGAIYAKWIGLGGLTFGRPITDEVPTPDGVGRFNHFESDKSIYWSPGTGAAAIWGQIRKCWSELGWERSYLGYPTSDEVEFADAGRANDFQNGGIYWWPDTGAVDLRDVVVHYTGIFCFGETDNDQLISTADEPYAILSVSTPRMAETKNATQIYAGVDAGEGRPDLMEIYHGRPYGINLGVVLMEHDEGDPDKYKQVIQDAVMKVHEAGTAALGLIPLVGPAIAAAAGPVLGQLMPSIGGAISDAFDFGDDLIGGSTTVVSAKQMVLLAARTPNTTFNEIGYKVESDLISGQGASYKVYFGVVPA